jgi:hypothetical protein
MWMYSNAAHRVTVVAPRRFRLEPRTLILSTHRRETDVPVICPPLFFGAKLWKHREERMSFAARDDMFLPGFFAGFPPDLSPRTRRLLFPVNVGRFLPRVQVHPISSASVARAGELVRAVPDATLAEALPADVAAAFERRAAKRGLPVPKRGRDVLRGEYADLLWQGVERDATPSLDDFWARRAARAAADFRTLVELVRSGGTLVVFPEGRPSPKGEIGPLRRGLGALVRRAEPRWFLPVGLGYDPLVRGRTRVCVVVGPRVDPPETDLETTALRLLRLHTPLTCGQFVAHELLAGRRPDVGGLGEAVEEAQAVARPVEPDLLDAAKRAERLAEALAAAEKRSAELPFLAREYASAREI